MTRALPRTRAKDFELGLTILSGQFGSHDQRGLPGIVADCSEAK